MKKIYAKIISAVLALCTAAAVSGCANNNEASRSETTVPTTAETTQETVSENSGDELNNVLRSIHSYDAENGDVFAGAWQITEGGGSQYKSFVYLFDGKGKASMVIDTSGFMGKYEVKESNGETVFITQLSFGLNGEYTCKFSDGNSKVTLTNKEDNSKTVMQKLVNFDCVPIPEKNPKIDKALLGAWKSDDEESFYFDESGIMYHNQYGTMFYYATYSAENSQIKAIYKMGEETADNYEYNVNGDTLMLGEYEYKRVSLDEIA